MIQTALDSGVFRVPQQHAAAGQRHGGQRPRQRVGNVANALFWRRRHREHLEGACRLAGSPFLSSSPPGRAAVPPVDPGADFGLPAGGRHLPRLQPPAAAHGHLPLRLRHGGIAR
ncbi:hypothetical protein KL86PLE_20217 [uncultured Pleomorphomonas sp.]|uniref:Uncharacterized protein n=1 Tax=uncultured Pleomorphomonas sp. TaxID=442121 RepID=A0A212LDW4_9HYPH|nr:hypothetical protein KL86PLE_20217 [uncultured Pleomorphomonas sp.]